MQIPNPNPYPNVTPKSSFQQPIPQIPIPQIPQQEPSRRFERFVRGFGPYRMPGPLTPYYSKYLTNQYNGQELPQYVLNKILRNAGKRYYQTYFSQEPFQQFLRSNRGTSFLGTFKGKQFLGTQPGLKFLQTEQGKQFLNSYPGQEYLKEQIKIRNGTIIGILYSIKYFKKYYGKLLLCDKTISEKISGYSRYFYPDLIFNVDTIQKYFNKIGNENGINDLINNLNNFQNYFNALRKIQYENPRNEVQQIIDNYFYFFKRLMDQICSEYPEPIENPNTFNQDALINLIKTDNRNQKLIIESINNLNSTLTAANSELYNIVENLQRGILPGSYGAFGGKRTFYFEHGGKQSKIKAEKPKKAAEKVYKKTKAEKITVKDKKTGKKYHYSVKKDKEGNATLKNKK